MKIKRLYINNYKSLVDFELVEPNPFSVFVGPNAAGKSNVFEALEFLSYAFKSSTITPDLFGGPDDFLYKNAKTQHVKSDLYRIEFLLNFNDVNLEYTVSCMSDEKRKRVVAYGSGIKGGYLDEVEKKREVVGLEEKEYASLFSRVFSGNNDLVKIKTNGSEKLRIDAHNMEAVLHRILQDEIKREEIMEWVDMLIPGLEKIDVVKSEYSEDYILRVFEKHMDEPIRKNLISNGTYNILALLTAVYQSDEPQFLCIEEPENGLNPYVIRELVGFFRQVCEEKGHYIWLNTHSATLVKELEPKELILINKIEGVTKAKQVNKDFNLHGLSADEAWLSNAFGGGLPW